MQVLLIRHSLAVPDSPSMPDACRYLSEKGRQRATLVGRALSEQRIDLDALLTSPLVRAVQTAELIASELGFDGEVRTAPGLAPGVPPEVLVLQLTSYGRSLALVGHAPGISAVGAVLLGRPAFPPLLPGQVCCIRDGEPQWTIHPERLSPEPLLVA